MSYILNALRKSEQERQAHTPTPQSSIYQERTTEKRRGVWLIVALIAINLLTLLFFIRLSTTEHGVEQPDTSDRRVVPAKETQPEHSLYMPGALQKHPAIVLPSRSGKLSQPASKAHDFSISGVVDARRPRPSVPATNTDIPLQKNNPARQTAASSRPSYMPPSTLVDSPTLTPKATKSASIPSPAEPKSNSASSSQRRQAMLSARQAAPPAAIKKTKALKASKNPADRQLAKLQSNINATSSKTMPHRQPAAAKTAAKKPTVPLLSELPLEFRRQVPKININVFVYADEPQQRFVIVDMAKYRTGENIQQKIRLKEILSDSLVVEYMGKTFRIMRP